MTTSRTTQTTATAFTMSYHRRTTRVTQYHNGSSGNHYQPLPRPVDHAPRFGEHRPPCEPPRFDRRPPWQGEHPPFHRPPQGQVPPLPQPPIFAPPPQPPEDCKPSHPPCPPEPPQCEDKPPCDDANTPSNDYDGWLDENPKSCDKSPQDGRHPGVRPPSFPPHQPRPSQPPAQDGMAGLGPILQKIVQMLGNLLHADDKPTPRPMPHPKPRDDDKDPLKGLGNILKQIVQLLINLLGNDNDSKGSPQRDNEGLSSLIGSIEGEM